MNGNPTVNPYVVLGIPFGSSRDIASRAFAAKAKSVRRQPNGAAILTELTWALNQVTDVLQDPDAAVDVYRVPANPDALEPSGEGLFRPGPEVLQRFTETTDEDHSAVRVEIAREAVRYVLLDLADRVRLPNR